ncbi:MAG TPA: Crp/Fnr family transcriptional regulator [Candidatus Angelobacter sp.]|jgi:CRP/FNR family transcriptional regulator|nr:Crp/Fnr family transcriptional regulator [Candidatus Angelobacter sp.]
MLSPNRRTAFTDGYTSSVRQSGQAFGNLQGETRARFEAIGEETSVARGESLFMEGQEQRYMYVVCSGRVKLSVSSREGKSVILRIAGQGDVLGLSAALAGTAHDVTAVVLENCTVKAFRVRDFLAFLENHPEAAMEATRCVLQEYKVVFNNVCRLALPNTVAGRLANLLLELRNTPFTQSPDRRLTMALTHEEIAGMTGTSRETVSRVLQQFQRDKFICIKGSSLTVLQPEALEQLAV